MSAMPHQRAVLIEARDATVHLGGRTVVDRISLSLQSGQVTALVGPNGAGKSTLLKALAGLLPLASGVIRHGDGASVARQVAYLPQDRMVHWDLTVAKVVALGRLARNGAPDAPSAADIAAIERAMERLRITPLAARPIRALSGGERARVLIARALAQETPVLLADEPAAGLDPAHQLSLFEHLRGLAAEARAVLVAVHDLTLAARFADRVVLLAGGRIAADGPPDEALSREHLATAFGIDVAHIKVEGVRVLVPLAARDTSGTPGATGSATPGVTGSATLGPRK